MKTDIAVIETLTDEVASFLARCYFKSTDNSMRLDNIVHCHFSDPLESRECRRIIDSITDFMISQFRRSLSNERVDVSKLVREITELFARPSKIFGVVTPPEANDDAHNRLLNELSHLTNEAAAAIPPFESRFPQESLLQLSHSVEAIRHSLTSVHSIKSEVRNLVHGKHADPTYLRYESDYRLAVLREVDRVELFGADILPEAKRNVLSDAFISVNVRYDPLADSVLLPFERVLDGLGKQMGRLLVRGVAGSGKTTLLRWAALQCAKQGSTPYFTTLEQGRTRIANTLDSGEDPTPEALDEINAVNGQWRNRIPFLILLRHCQDGKLPVPEKLAIHISQEVGVSPPEWVEAILKGGRGFILLDGIDEVPVLNRDELRTAIRNMVRSYPTNMFVVTTRPEAVPVNWLDEFGFLESEVSPMSSHDTIRFVKKWHEAVKRELVRTGKPILDIDILAQRLMDRLRNDPSIGPLATNPLLCAMLCALHHYRSGKLPETLRSLCEALCEMLLHRRERESGLDWGNFPAPWPELQYDQKRALVQGLGYYMVLGGKSAVSFEAAVHQIEVELVQLPGRRAEEASTILKALIERSGMLREVRPPTPSEPGVVDFLHNTFKEYLAGERFALQGETDFLVKKCIEDPTWRRVALFAVAANTDTFPTRFIRGLLSNVPRISRQPDQDGSHRELQLFCLQCRAVALRLDSDLNSELEVLLTDVFPPRRLRDGELIATIGELAVPFLKKRRDTTAEEAAASVRALRLINTIEARSLLEDYMGDERDMVIQEVAYWINPLTIPAIRRKVEAGEILPQWLSGQVNDLSPLGDVEGLTAVNLFGTAIEDLSTIPAIDSIEKLDITGTQVSSLLPISRLISLAGLKASGSSIRDLNGIEDLYTLQVVECDSTEVHDLRPLKKLHILEKLDVSATQIASLKAIESCVRIKVLRANKTRIVDLEPLCRFEYLTELHVNNTRITTLQGLEECRRLRRLDVSDTPLSDISAIRGIQSLEWLDVSRTKVSDLSPLKLASKLKDLIISELGGIDVTSLLDKADLRINGRPFDEWAVSHFRNEVFVSYARTDKKVLEELQVMLKPAIGKHEVNIWCDKKIEAGENWERELKKALGRARVGVLLVSKEFLASEYIMSTELPYLLEVAKSDLVELLWVPLEHCLYEQSPLNDIKAVIDPKKPLNSYKGSNRNKQLKDVAGAIQKSLTNGPRFRR